MVPKRTIYTPRPTTASHVRAQDCRFNQLHRPSSLGVPVLKERLFVDNRCHFSTTSNIFNKFDDSLFIQTHFNPKTRQSAPLANRGAGWETWRTEVPTLRGCRPLRVCGSQRTTHPSVIHCAPLVPPRSFLFLQLTFALHTSHSSPVCYTEAHLHAVCKECVRHLCGRTWCFGLWEKRSSSNSNSAERSKHAAVDSSPAPNKLLAVPPQQQQQGQTSASSGQTASASVYSVR